jgi:WD40 repeat protein
VDLWRVEDSTRQQHLTAAWGWSFNRTPRRLRFAAEGQRLAVEETIAQSGAAFSVAATTWDLETPGAATEAWNLTELKGPDSFDLRAWTFSPSAGVTIWVDKNNQVQLQRSDGSQLLLTDVGSFSALEFNTDGKLFAIGDQSGTVQILKTEGGYTYDTVQAAGPVDALRFSPDGTLLGAQRRDGVVMVWHLGEQQPFASIAASARDSFTFTADNQMLVTGSEKGVTFYNLVNGRILRKLDTAAQDIAMSPDQRVLAVLHNGRVVLWGVP